MAPDHRLDHRAAVRFGDRGEERDVTVAQDLDAVGDRGDFVEPVGDVDDRHALVAQASDEREQRLGFVVRQGGGRLVEDEQLGRARQRPRDLDDLALADPQGRHQPTGIDVDPELLEDRRRPPVDLAPVDDTQAVGKPPKRDVLGDGQGRGVLELLEDDRDAEVASGDRGERGMCDLADR